MGSKSDYEIMKHCADTLEKFDVKYEIIISSAHRSPERTKSYIKEAEEKGAVAFIGAAGMAAHLAGIVAANTLLPVIAIPISSTLNGLDALLSSVQMPSGIPVATVAIDGSKNAALLSAQIIALDNDEVLSRLIAFRKQNKKSSLEANDKLKEIL